jgi:8-hydroxy-5-deazaflavin:NADPH oxidoreductase
VRETRTRLSALSDEREAAGAGHFRTKVSEAHAKRVRIAVIGTGRMGSALASQLAAAGHEVRLGSRDRERGRQKAEEIGAAFGGTSRAAAANAEVVVLAVPWTAVFETLGLLGDLDGTVLVDVTNPFKEGSSSEQHDLLGSSGAEQIQAFVPDARVVKAWNHIYSAVIRRSPDFGGIAATVFVAADDPHAKELVATLVKDIGYDPADAGLLASARYLEPLAGFMTTLDRLAGGEFLHALKLLRRARRTRPSEVGTRDIARA